ncbi:hypothetical protein Nwi_2066 [Nitrobacter winogradskyi Nb-255]|uniref:Uncharacterized protein n=1 Tax=Nitrobacter winogradskyi (strain ATCC 25391 / DSM 10237 / CIP 104748 / NCIMB 11846 / Nb-255) TaxID=323098 RepID=Q3SQW7_NITWN|nr:hypothetical protein Nwi_2066 [Nitrobacter winogradskyi Nb-255]
MFINAAVLISTLFPAGRGRESLQGQPAHDLRWLQGYQRGGCLTIASNGAFQSGTKFITWRGALLVCAGRAGCRPNLRGAITGEVPNGRLGWRVYFSFEDIDESWIGSVRRASVPFKDQMGSSVTASRGSPGTTGARALVLSGHEPVMPAS